MLMLALSHTFMPESLYVYLPDILHYDTKTVQQRTFAKSSADNSPCLMDIQWLFHGFYHLKEEERPSTLQWLVSSQCMLLVTTGKVI